MAKGLKIPLQVGANGRTVVIEGDEQADKIIRLALSDNDNENAFQQDIGLGSEVVFNIRNPSFRARVLAKLFKMFAEFETAKLFRLDRTTIRWRVEKEGEQVLEFKYVNLESDEVETFVKAFTATGASQ